jgi:hypothetical protein
MGVHDGTVFVTAMYRNEMAECRVQVKSAFYLKLQYDVFLTYPGARKEGNRLIEIEYEVRPFTTQVMWTPQGPTPDANDPVARVTASTQNYETGKGKITIDPVKEGSFTLIGLTNRSTARMTVLIQNVYRLQISNNRFFMQPGETTEYENPQPGVPWDNNSRYKYIIKRNDNEDKIGDSIYIPFTFCPPEYLIGFEKDSIDLMEKYGIKYEMSPLLRLNDLEGRRIIKLTATREIPFSEYGNNNEGMILALEMKKPFEETVIDNGFYSSNPVYPNNYIYIKSQLPRYRTAVIPVFQRVYGAYSNPNSVRYKYYEGNNGANWKNKTALTDIGPNANDHFDINDDKWKYRPTGVLPEFNNQEYYEGTSEYIPLTSFTLSSGSGGHGAVYNLELGDGEEHYIILDKTHEGMYYEFEGASINGFSDKFKDIPFYKNSVDRRPSAKLETLDNGSRAIKISGGKDFMVYDRILAKKRKVHTFEYYYKSSVTGFGRDVSKDANIYNDKSAPFQFNGYISGLDVAYRAIDSVLVNSFGVPLSTMIPDDGGVEYVTSEDGKSTYLVESSVLKDSVQYQIVYWREKNPNGSDGWPIRVRYNYSINNLHNMVSVIANDGSSVDFQSAKDYFKEGPLYYTRIDAGEDYYIKRANGATQDYFDNPVISQVSTLALHSDQYFSHDQMVERNPHFDGRYRGVLYIVSDFDLGLKQKLWYIPRPAMYERMGVGITSENESSSDYMGNLKFSSASVFYDGNGGSHIRDYFRVFYSLKNRNSNTITKDDLIYWNDGEWTDGVGDFYNYYNGKALISGTFASQDISDRHLFLMPSAGHILSNKLNGGRDIVFMSTASWGYLRSHIGEVGPSNSRSYLTEADQAHYKAIISMLKHNNSTIASETVLDNIKSLAEFKTFYNGLSPANQNTIRTRVMNANARGFIMGSANQSATDYEPFNTKTVYVKIDTEENHNSIYRLSDFTSTTAVNNFPFKTNTAAQVKNQTVVNENICDSDYYEPVVSTKENVVYSSDPVELVLSYKNSYSNSNTITIRITHKVRGNEARNQPVRTTWNMLEAVKSLTELDASFTNLNYKSVYSTYVRDYFFVPKRTEDSVKY